MTSPSTDDKLLYSGIDTEFVVADENEAAEFDYDASVIDIPQGD